jgi:hypothetical protein
MALLVAAPQSSSDRLNRITDYLINEAVQKELRNLPKPKDPNTITKTEFEKQSQYEERIKRAKLAQISYQSQIDQLRAKAQPKALKQALATIYGKPTIKELTYVAEIEKFVATLNFKNRAINQKVVIAVPQSKAREFKEEFKSYKLSTSFELKEDRFTIHHINLTKGAQNYEAHFSDSLFVATQEALLLKTNYQSIAQTNQTKQKEFMLSNALYDNALEEQIKKLRPVKSNPKKWALIIGIQEYKNSDNISHAKRSALTYEKLLVRAVGVPKSNITTLIDSDATAKAIEIAFKRLDRKMQKGDTLYFYYNGHGIPVPTQQNEPYMLSSDGDAEFVQDDKFFALKNVYAKLSDSKASRIIAVVDSCFSGGSDGKSVLKGVAATRLKPRGVEFNKRKMVVLAAGKGSQYSNGYDEKGHRLFSYYVMKSIADGATNLKSIYRNAYKLTKSTSRKLYGDLRLQEPTIEGNARLGVR